MEYSKITAMYVNGLINQALEADPQMGWIGNVSMESPSRTATEKYAWLGQVPAMREWMGKRKFNKLNEFDYSIRNKSYEMTLAVHRDDLFEDKTGLIMQRIGDMIGRSNTHWASLITQLIVDGDAAKCYDGQYFFDTDHSSGKSGDQTNLLTKTDLTELDFTTTGKPTAVEMSAALIAIAGKMMTYKDDQGEPMNEMARSFSVVVPTPAYYTAAVQAINKSTIVSGSTAVENPVFGSGLKFNGPYLNTRLAADSSALFYVFRDDAPIKPFIRQQEGPVNQNMLDESSDHYFTNKEIVWGIDTNRAAGYGLWQYAVSANGTT